MAKTGLFGIASAVSGGGGTVTITQPAVTPSTLDISTLSGNTNVLWKSFTFVVRAGTMLIDGNTFGTGTYTFDNGAGTIASMTYDATLGTDVQLIVQQ